MFTYLDMSIWRTQRNCTTFKCQWEGELVSVYAFPLLLQSNDIYSVVDFGAVSGRALPQLNNEYTREFIVCTHRVWKSVNSCPACCFIGTLWTTMVFQWTTLVRRSCLQDVGLGWQALLFCYLWAAFQRLEALSRIPCLGKMLTKGGQSHL